MDLHNLVPIHNNLDLTDVWDCFSLAEKCVVIIVLSRQKRYVWFSYSIYSVCMSTSALSTRTCMDEYCTTQGTFIGTDQSSRPNKCKSIACKINYISSLSQMTLVWYRALGLLFYLFIYFLGRVWAKNYCHASELDHIVSKLQAPLEMVVSYIIQPQLGQQCIKWYLQKNAMKV